MFNKLKYIMDEKDKRKIIPLCIIMIVGSILEFMGVSVFLPFVQVLMSPEIIFSNKILNTIRIIFHMDTETKFLVFISAVIIIVYIIKDIYLCLMHDFILRFSYGQERKISTKLLKSYMSEPYSFHLNKNTAELQRSILSDSIKVMYTISALLQLVAEVCVILVLVGYLFVTNWSMTFIIGSLLSVCLLIFVKISRKISKNIGIRNLNYYTKMNQWIYQSIGGVKEIKVLNREPFFVNSFENYCDKYVRGERITTLIATLPRYVVEAVCIAGMLIAIIVEILYGNSEMTAFIPQLSVFAVAALRLLPSVGKINGYINTIMYNMGAVDLVYTALKEVNQLDAILDFHAKKGDKLSFEKLIRIENLQFSYLRNEKKVLDNVSLSITKGEAVAIIGASGAGKTTLIDIILGVLQPQSGSVYVDGCDIFSNLSGWHQQIGYIPQNIYLSDDTIRNNIAFGIDSEDIDDERVLLALEKAQLKEFVLSMEEGLDSLVGERGVRLSGGQRQRIGIARALYHDPEVLIMDEATSALDNETEKAVMQAIEKLKGSKTMIIIAHRMSTIKNVDVIYEVDNGCVHKVDNNLFFSV